MRERQPAHLHVAFSQMATAPALARSVSPTMAFAVLGQAKANGELAPEAESRMLAGAVDDLGGTKQPRTCLSLARSGRGRSEWHRRSSHDTSA